MTCSVLLNIKYLIFITSIIRKSSCFQSVIWLLVCTLIIIILFLSELFLCSSQSLSRDKDGQVDTKGNSGGTEDDLTLGAEGNS